MIDRAIVLNALAHIDTREGAAKPGDSQLNLMGLFVHTGVMELITPGNEGIIANVSFVIGATRLRRLIWRAGG
jgi:hypothetical protein